MKYVLVLFCSMLVAVVSAQQESVKTLQQTAARFVNQGDYSNAILVLNRAIQQEPENTAVSRELAFAQYLQHDYARAVETIRPLLDKRDADVETFQVAGMIYQAKGDGGEAEKLYKRGIRKFPDNGALYNDYGDLLWYRKDNSAIRQWEKGIEVDPNYTGNYYNAAKYYYFTADKVWSVIYGEIFINMESYSRRTIEVKNLLLDSYKKLFTDPDMMKNQSNKNEFTTAFLSTMARQSSVAAMGITPESLTMIRARFVLDWDAVYTQKFPYRLFEYHRQLLKMGLFDAYNEWLFGPVQNLTAFQNWTSTHAETYSDFTTFQQGRVFKMPVNQNYQNRQ